MLDVYSSGSGAHPSGHAVERAGEAALACAAGVGVAWGLLGWAVGRQWRRPERRAGLRRAHDLVLVAVGLAATIAVLASAGAIVHRVRDQARAFVTLHGTATGGSRFLSGSGQRYDYWRIAWRDFRDQPLRGQGAGSYPVRYFRERRTLEDVRQPHSMEMQTLAELGLLGALALAAFVVAVLVGLVRTARRPEAAGRAVAVAAGGAFTAWLVHASVDWIYLFPSLTGIALCAAAGLLVTSGAPPARGPGRSAVGWLAVGALGLVVAFAAVEMARPVLALHARTQGRAALAHDPRRALARARDSLSYEPDAIDGRYLEAAAYARLGDYDRARAALLRALHRQPHDFITWALLGDLAVRRGDLATAGAAYRQASRLNPRDPTLRELARDPRRALAGG